MNKPVSIIIVTYNNAQTIELCLKSVKKQENLIYQLIVVDNASSDDTISLVEKHDPDYLIERKTNGGFATAANEGARLATSPYLLFLNPDVELKEAAIEELVKVIEKKSQIAIVGGKFVTKDNKAMVSFGNFPSVKTEIFQKLKLHKILPFGRYIVPSLLSRSLFNKTRQVDWVSGGFCLIRKNLFQTVDGFDQNYFLYLEDIDLAKRITDQGFKVLFSPKAQAIHHQHRSASEVAKKYEKESLEYYKNKFK